MDKRKPTYQLTEVRRLIIEERFKLSNSARKAIDLLGFSKTKIKETILELESKDFYKSTTEYANHKVWQDVYKKTVRNVRLYIKLKVVKINGQLLLITSFKEDESG